MSPSSWILWTLVWTGWILSFVESVDPNQSKQDNEFTQEDFDELLQLVCNQEDYPEVHLDVDFFGLSEGDQMGDGSVAPMGPFTQTAPSAILTPPHTLVQTNIQTQTQTHTPPLLQPQPQPNTQVQMQTQTFLTQNPAQLQMVMIVPAATPSHQFTQNQTLSTAPVHTVSQQVPTLMSCNTLTTGGGAITAGTGGAVKEGKRRKTHSINEKRYRSSINDKIQELRELLNIKDPKMPKPGVLQKAIKNLESLQQENLMLKRANQNNTSWDSNPQFNPQIKEFEESGHSNLMK